MQNYVVLLFDVSGGEFLVILLFILMFFGSKSIPDLARGLGKGYRQLKDASNSIKREIQSSSGEIGSLKRPLDQHLEDINKSLNDVDKDIKKDMGKLDQDLNEDLNK